MKLPIFGKDLAFKFFRRAYILFEKLVDKYYMIWIAAIFLTSLAIKLYIISLSTSLGADYGKYLTYADILRGRDITGKGLRYPPLYPLLLNIFLILLNEITALKVCASFLYSLIIIPYFFIARKIMEHNIFALAASLLIAYNTFYSEMMGWGGNANVFGITFLLVFLIYWTNSLQNIGRKKDKILAALFLSLAIGSHFLMAIYIVVFFVVFLLLDLLLQYKNRNQSFRQDFKNTLTVGSIGTVLSSFYIPSYKALIDSVVIRESNFASAVQQLLGVSFYLLHKNLINIFFLLLGIIGIMLMFINGKKQFSLTLTSLLISGFLPMFFTLHPARWSYFWPIPMFLGFVFYVRDIFSRIRRKHLATRTVASISMIVLVFVYISNSAIYLFETSSYYNVLSPSTLEAFEYIRKETKLNSVIATSGPYRRGGEGSGHNYGWWIEGFTDRKCVATAYLRFLMYYDEREIAQDANILFSGTDVIMNDFVMVAETFPSGLGNPELGVNIGDFYEKLLFFADNETTLLFDSHQNITLNKIKKEINSIAFNDKVVVNATYIYEFATVFKKISLLNDSTVEVTFEIHQSNMVEVIIPLFKSDFTYINSYYEKNEKNVAVKIMTPMGAPLELNITVDHNSNYFNKTFFKQTSDKWQKFVEFSFSGLPKPFFVRFRFRISNVGFSAVKYFSSYELIERRKVDYILINKSRLREFDWFSKDKHFEKWYENEEVAIFRVVK
ncbi:MAG: hypothetical protein QXG39_04765 [Candidatus Aenigmatarchaeota archaeon]